MVISESSIATTCWQRVFELLIQNKPSGWSVKGSFPDEPDFPCIVVNPVEVSMVAPELTGNVRLYQVSVEIELFCPYYTSDGSFKGMKSVDTARDAVRYAFVNNQTYLKNAGLYLSAEPFDDSNVDSFDSNGIRLNTSGIIVSMVMR